MTATSGVVLFPFLYWEQISYFNKQDNSSDLSGDEVCTSSPFYCSFCLAAHFYLLYYELEMSRRSVQPYSVELQGCVRRIAAAASDCAACTWGAYRCCRRTVWRRRGNVSLYDSYTVTEMELPGKRERLRSRLWNHVFVEVRRINAKDKRMHVLKGVRTLPETRSNLASCSSRLDCL